MKLPKFALKTKVTEKALDCDRLLVQLSGQIGYNIFSNIDLPYR
jgi:hypothetical protein